jgi:glyoxylase-like metal-dependent hydrolase (beta-lactamase superfamily II)
MIEEILNNLYKIEIPLPKNPLRSVNSYLIKGLDRNLLIDTGMNRDECMNVMQAGLRKLGVDLMKTDFFITHLHIDHLGLVSRLTTDKSTIYFNQADADRLDRIKSDIFWGDMINFIQMNGFPAYEIQKVLLNNPSYIYRLTESLSFKILKDEDTISIGNYLFKCIETPGHSKGHMCLYEPNKKIFVAGDHILNDITPIISLRSNEGNPLREYLISLDKVYQLDIELVLPGHRGIFNDCKQRIMELKHHHEKRADEITSLLENGLKNAYEVASHMSWDVPLDSWDRFPVVQKWFAIGEVISHLKYLEEKEVIRKDIQEQMIVYSLNRDLSVQLAK